MDVVYRLEDVTKLYGDRTVLAVDRLDIQAGEVFGVVGPSGAGKSTLLRLLNFLELPSSGRLTYRDFRVDGVPPPLRIRRQVTTVFQRPTLLDRSVSANVAYGLHLRGQRQVEGAVMESLQLLGLSDLAGARARQLSGGEAQRVALARALIIQPDVLLLDEPTANLDPHNVGLIEGVIRRVNEERGTIVVLVTHNVFQARRLAHRVGLLLNGQLVEVADTATFFDAPSDPRTSAFVRGDMVY